MVGKESEPIFQWTRKHGQTVQFNVVFHKSNHKLIAFHPSKLACVVINNK